LPELQLESLSVQEAEDVWRHELTMVPPAAVEEIQLSIPQSVPVRRILINGILAFDESKSKHRKWQTPDWILSLAMPGTDPVSIDVITGSPEPVSMTSRSRFPIPDSLTRVYRPDWPADAEAAFLGPRALKIQHHGPDN
jgi:hypothetical protein